MNGPALAPEQQNLIVVFDANNTTSGRADLFVRAVLPGDAEIPFDWILAAVTGSDSTITDYVMENPAICPRC